VALLVALRPAPAAAQTGFIVAGHLGSSAAAPGGTMVDVAGEVHQGLVGMRFGVGMDAAGTPLGSIVSAGEETSGVWSSDADLGLNLGRIPYMDVLFGRTNPTVFLGGGLAGVSSTDAESGDRSSTLVPTWNYGARGTLPLTSWLGVELEARHRTTFGDVDATEYPSREGWEYRAGLALRFGGRSASRTLPAPRGGSTSGGRSTSARLPTRDEVRSEDAEEIADRAIRTADGFLGTRYRWGGDSPSEGFDCSGFVQYVFRQHGITLPRVSRDQARAGRALETSVNGLARGDLLFFAQGGPTVDHVAIYAGDGRIIHASSSGRGVRYDQLTGDRGRWYVQHLVAVRRVIGAEAVVPRQIAPSDADLPDARRAMPLDEAFDALLAERGDAAPPPEQ
jgi:cell wall-associated NlpC family hydrolase